MNRSQHLMRRVAVQNASAEDGSAASLNMSMDDDEVNKIHLAIPHSLAEELTPTPDFITLTIEGGDKLNETPAEGIQDQG